MTPIFQIITDKINENQLNLRYLCSISLKCKFHTFYFYFLDVLHFQNKLFINRTEIVAGTII